jgi:uncharacterized protein YecT (DUF1311 family)
MEPDDNWTKLTKKAGAVGAVILVVDGLLRVGPILFKKGSNLVSRFRTTKGNAPGEELSTSIVSEPHIIHRPEVTYLEAVPTPYSRPSLHPAARPVAIVILAVLLLGCVLLLVLVLGYALGRDSGPSSSREPAPAAVLVPESRDAASEAQPQVSPGATRLDMSAVSRSVSDEIGTQLGLPIASIDCPKDSGAGRAGATFECVATPRDGGRITVKVTEKDDIGNVSWEVAKAEGLLNLRAVENAVTQGLKQQTGVDAKVNCGGRFRATKTGDQVDCQATSADGNSTPVTVTVKDDQGNVGWELEAAPAPMVAPPTPEPGTQEVPQGGLAEDGLALVPAETRPPLGSPTNEVERTPRTTNPSFDCASARTAVEILICGDEELASADREMAVIYGQVLSGLTGSKALALRQEHKIWFRAYTDACNATNLRADERKACILRFLTTRTEQLRAIRLPSSGV